MVLCRRKRPAVGWLPVLCLVVTFSSGCVVKEMGTAIKHSITGEHFLSRQDYSQGAEKFRTAVTDNPDSALANYYYGRFLLGDKEYRNALKYLQKAADLDSTNADYQFWVGVAQGSTSRKSLEKKSYLKALAIDNDHLQSLTYLGHNLLEDKKYSQALESYNRALAIWPESPSALYNRALILTKLSRKPEALEGWQGYLSCYPSGAMTRQAVVHLNNLGDFSFRNHSLRTRTVTIEKIYFQPFSARLARESYPSLQLIGAVYRTMKKGRLQIVVYQLNNKELAKKKALNIKRYLLKEYPEIGARNIGVSWFATPETITTGSAKQKLNDSVNFFISV